MYKIYNNNTINKTHGVLLIHQEAYRISREHKTTQEQCYINLKSYFLEYKTRGTVKQKLLKYRVADMYIWQYCGIVILII